MSFSFDNQRDRQRFDNWLTTEPEQAEDSNSSYNNPMQEEQKMTKNLLAKQIVGAIQANVNNTDECIALVEDMLAFDVKQIHTHRWTFVRSFKEKSEAVDEYACHCGAHCRSKVFYIEQNEVS